MEFVRSRGGAPGALRTTEAAAQLLSAAKGLDGLTTTWLEKPTSRRLRRPCTRAD